MRRGSCRGLCRRAGSFSGSSVETFLAGSATQWLRADSGIILNGADVSTWEDQGPNGFDLVQSTAELQPLWTAADAGFNGQSSVQFVRAEYHRLPQPAGMLSAISGAAGATVIVVRAFDETTINRYSWNIDATDFAGAMQSPSADRCYVGGSANYGQSADLGTTKRIVSTRFDGAGADNAARLKMSVDGSPISPAYTGTIPATLPAIASGALGGTAAGGNSGTVSQRFAEWILFARALTDAELGTIEAYLRARYAI